MDAKPKEGHRHSHSKEAKTSLDDGHRGSMDKDGQEKSTADSASKPRADSMDISKPVDTQRVNLDNEKKVSIESEEQRGSTDTGEVPATDLVSESEENKEERRLSLEEEKLFIDEQELEELRQKARQSHLQDRFEGAAIGKAKANVRQVEDRVKLRYISFFLVTTILCILMFGHLQFLTWKEKGSPPTFHADLAYKRLKFAIFFGIVVAPLGFTILFLKFGNIILAFVWLFAIVVEQYIISISIANAVLAYISGTTFKEIKEFSKVYYVEYGSIPPFMANFEESHKCCGWNTKQFMYSSWPDLLEIDDLPESCCVRKRKNCGRNAVIRGEKSGRLMRLSEKEMNILSNQEVDKWDAYYWTDPNSIHAKVFRYFDIESEIPDDILRMLDERKDAPYYYVLGERIRQTSKDNETSVVTYVYYSLGQTENIRLNGFMHPEPCDTKEMVAKVRYITLFILIYSVILGLLSSLMPIFFWFYYTDIKTEEMAREDTAGEFAVLKIDQINIDNGFNKILLEKERLAREIAKKDRKRIKQEMKRKQKLEQERQKMETNGTTNFEVEKKKKEEEEKEKLQEKEREQEQQRLKEQERQKLQEKEREEEQERQKLQEQQQEEKVMTEETPQPPEHKHHKKKKRRRSSQKKEAEITTEAPVPIPEPVSEQEQTIDPLDEQKIGPAKWAKNKVTPK